MHDEEMRTRREGRPGIGEFLAVILGFGMVKTLFLGGFVEGTALAYLAEAWRWPVYVYAVLALLTQLGAVTFYPRWPKLLARLGWGMGIVGFSMLFPLAIFFTPESIFLEINLIGLILMVRAFFRRGDHE